MLALSLVNRVLFQYGKEYGSVEEFQARYSVFRDSARLVQQHNDQEWSYKRMYKLI